MEDIKNQNFKNQEEINNYFAFRQEEINETFAKRQQEINTDFGKSQDDLLKVVILIHSLNFILIIFTLCAINCIDGYYMHILLFHCIAGYGLVKLNKKLCDRANKVVFEKYDN